VRTVRAYAVAAIVEGSSRSNGVGISARSAGCLFTIAYSSSSSAVGFVRTLSGTAFFPTTAIGRVQLL
jgi:hypothetical protein